jgi:hypothetical protein
LGKNIIGIIPDSLKNLTDLASFFIFAKFTGLIGLL